MERRAPLPLLLCALLAAAGSAHARTVYRCVQAGTVSLATAPEPGSRCVAHEVDDQAITTPDLWGRLGVVRGTLYEREQDGQMVYSTRRLPGSVAVLGFTVRTPEPPAAPQPDSREKPVAVPAPRLDRYAPQFKAAARRTGVDDAWLRAIAHAESGFDPAAVSPKGALGVMQLMPDTARELGVADPFEPRQSIDGGARHLRMLMRRYRGNLELVAAAYNAGVAAVTRHRGVPPYGETRAYVRRVLALHARYRQALAPGG